MNRTRDWTLLLDMTSGWTPLRLSFMVAKQSRTIRYSTIALQVTILNLQLMWQAIEVVRASPYGRIDDMT